MTNKHAIYKQLTTHNSQLTKYAFTLAETLIVMGIIGVVAALTLPNLNSSTGDKEKVVKVKKIYQNLNDVMGRAVAVYGPVEDWFVNDLNSTAQTTRAGERLTEFMKLSKNCKMTEGCYTGDSDTISDFYKVILSDGTGLGLRNLSNVIYFYIDIDGINKGKNSEGYDRFTFCTSNDSVVPVGDVEYPYQKGESTIYGLCGNSGTKAGCTRWVIDFGNMDYLKLDSSGKCPNGKALNFLANPPVTSCK